MWTNQEKKNYNFFFYHGDFLPFMSKSFQIWDHFFPLLFPKNSKPLKFLDIQLWEVGAKRPLNDTSKVNRHTDRQTHTCTHIWVRFLRTGIGPELCDFFKKFGWLLWPNVNKNNFVFNLLWEIFFTKVLGKKYGSLWHLITTLHYTTLHLKMPSLSTLH